MNAGKVREVVETYRSFFELWEVDKVKHANHYKPNFDSNVLQHCHWMLDQIEEFVSEGRMGKAYRWLGFIQGCLWSTGQYNIDDLREHNCLD